MPKATNAAMMAANEALFARAKIRPEWQGRIDGAAKRLCLPQNKRVFETESRRLAARGYTVPWYVIAVTKEMEAGMDTGFRLSIAQGDPWDSISKNVPRGRGPFDSWYEAADDALIKCAPYMALWKNWTTGGTLTILMKYNGIGYFLRNVPSAYLFSGTTVYVKGKFTSDGHWDPEAVSKQVGVAALLLGMQKFDPTVTFTNDNVDPRATAEPPKDVVDDATKGARNVRKAAGAGGVAGAGNEVAKTGTKTGTEVPSSTPLLPSVAAYSLIGVAVAVMIAATVMVAKKRAAVFAVW
jgi:lysozyme family protein